MRLLNYPYEVAHAISGRVVSILFVICMATDLAAGITFVVAGPEEFTSPAYVAAQVIMGIQAWGVFLLTMTVMTVFAAWVQGRCRLVGFTLTYLIGSGFWSFWTILLVLSTVGRNGVSPFLAVLSGSVMAVHILTGLAWPHPEHRHDMESLLNRLRKW